MLSIKELKENSQALKERYTEVYQSFFKEHAIVVSTDFSYSMVGGLSWRVGAPNIRHKLPFRTYIGIRSNGKKNTIDFGYSKVYRKERGEFVESEYLSEVWGDESCTKFEALLKEKIGSEDFDGFTISILAEREENMGFDSSMSLLYTTASMLYFKMINPETIEKFRNITRDEVYKKETEVSKKFNMIHRMVLNCGARMWHGIISGVTSFTAMIDSEVPVVYFTEPRNGSISKKYRTLAPLDVNEDCNVVESLYSDGFRLSEMADISGSFPLDVMSIYPGATRGYLSSTKYVKESLIPSFDQLRDDTKKLFKKAIEGNSEKLPDYLKNFDEDGVYVQKYIDGQVYNRLHLLRSLVNLYQNSMSTNAINDFLESTNAFMNFNAPFEESPSRNTQFIIRKVRMRAEEKGVDIAIRPLFWGKNDGNIFVYAQPTKFRQDIVEIINELQRDYNPDIQLDYASWRDGWGGKGIRIEQDIRNNIYSPLTPKGSARVLSWDGSDMKEELQDPSKVDPKKYDVLFDRINNEIYVGGKKFTSKELPTKKATIELFSFLAQHIGEIMLNSVLPKSSYASYRNDLQGKVIGPISKLVKEYEGKKLGVTISGDLRKFAVQFDPKNISIGFVIPMYT